MKTHRLMPIGVSCVWLLAVTSAKAQQAPQTYSFGIVTIAVPPPADYTEAFAGSPQLREYFAGPTKAIAGVLAGYIPAKALQRLRQTGRPEEIDSFALLGTSPELRSVTVTTDYFEAMAKKLRTGLGDALARSEPDIAAAVAEIGKRIGSDVRTQGSQALGIFDDRANRIGILLATPYTFDGTPISILAANTLIRVRGRLLFAYVYTRHLEPEAVTRLASDARSWTDAIFTANGEVPLRQRR
jgi:hypothetical protein